MPRLSDGDLIRKMLNGVPQKVIASEAGLTTRALQLRARKPIFQAELRRARDEAVQGAVAALDGRLTDAVEVLAQIMLDETVPPQVRVNAAGTLIDKAAKLTEITDILPRLAELERKAAAHDGGYRG